MLKTGVGTFIIEAIMSNGNGDPDNNGAPRQDLDSFGLISDVSFMRKIRDIIMDKQSPVWKKIAAQLGITDESRFDILENPDLTLQEVYAILKGPNGTEAFHNRFVDARLRGNTVLNKELGTSKHVRTGVVLPCHGRSIAPIEEVRMTCTKRTAVQEEKDRAMAPDRVKVVRHAVYCMDFSVNYANAHRTWCSQQDVDLFLACVPYAYAANKSTVRPSVWLRHARYAEFEGMGNQLLEIQQSWHPTKADPDVPSKSWDEYLVPALKNDIVKKHEERITKLVDLCDGV